MAGFSPISIHTSAREVTLLYNSGMPDDDFNPHFRKGSDADPNDIGPALTISIHTSAREVTVRKMDDVITRAISIHTSAREVTIRSSSSNASSSISIHTSAREVTMLRGLLHNVPAYFNPHFRKGSDKNG